MNNKKSFFGRKLVLYYLMFLVLVLIFAFFFMFFTVVDSAPVSTKPDTTAVIRETNPLSAIKKNTLRVNFLDWNKTCDWKLVVINGDNPFPKNSKPTLKHCHDVDVDYRIIPNLDEMIQDAAKQDIVIWLSSGYRSFEKQECLFENKVSQYLTKGYSRIDAENLAQGVVAKPFKSEHHTALAIDLNGVKDEFCHTKEYKWLMQNAATYGFVLRYQGEKQNVTGVIYEPWHFRYVGEKNAKEMKLKNMCLEEYVSYLMSKN